MVTEKMTFGAKKNMSEDRGETLTRRYENEMSTE